MNKTIAIIAIVALLVSAIGFSSYWLWFRSDEEPGDVVAIVNGETIERDAFTTRYKEVATLHAIYGLPFDPLTLERDVLDEMISEKLILQFAKEDGFIPTEEELEAAYQEYVEDFGTEDALVQRLAEDGNTIEDLKAHIKERMIFDLYITAYMDANVTEEQLAVTLDEVKDRYDYYADLYPDLPTYDLVEMELFDEISNEKYRAAIDVLIQDLRDRSEIDVFI